VKAGELEKRLDGMGVSVWVSSAWDREYVGAQLDGTDLVLTVGGDGTILRTVQAVLPETPLIAGINLGKLGFMTELDAGEAVERLPELLDSGGWIDERAMLQATLARAGREPQIFHALNDVVVARGEVIRVISVEVRVDGQYVKTYRTDGVIAATATGSTGYALAAGGPILHPQSGNFLLVPIAPHLGTSYALVLPETAELELRVQTFHAATLSIDGHINHALTSGDTITVKRSPCTARFLRVRDRESFYSCLEEKLKGKQGGQSREG